jgi:hypothetical protein
MLSSHIGWPDFGPGGRLSGSYRLLHSEDESAVLRAIVYLTDRRDGRPTQQLNITGTVAHFSPEEIARARAVVRELSLGATRTLEVAGATPLTLMGS